MISGLSALTVGRRHRRDLALPEAAGDRLLGEVLRPHAELVLHLARDALDLRDVLRRLAHREVDVREPAVVPGVLPRLGTRLGARPAARRRLREPGVGRVRMGVAVAVDVAADRLDAGADEHVTLAGLDRVERHPRRLQRAGAVAGQRGSGHVVQAEQRRDHPGHVEALLAAGESAAEQDVVDRVRLERRDLVQRRLDDRRGEVVGPHVLERPLERPADRRPRGRDDDGFDHGGGSSSSVVLVGPRA
jgi:hypothetical protein